MKAVLVNVFAGINRCDWVAEGVVQSLQKLDIKMPVVVRLSGAHVEEGQRILADADPESPLIVTDTLAEAGRRAVQAAVVTASAKNRSASR